MKKSILNIMPECYVDTNLIEYLLDAVVNHQHCCSKVVGRLNEQFKDKFAIGIIDKDKVELGYVKECEELASTTHLTLYKHKSRHQYLITISPAVDGFILDCTKEQSIDSEKFGIPSDLKGFTRLSKSVTSNTDLRFKKLFTAIKNNHEIRCLKDTLLYLCQNQYGTDIEQLITTFSRFH